MTFFEKITVLRKRRGLSERALAHALTIDPSAISRWRSRGNLPREAIAAHLAAYFGVPVELLTDDTLDLPAPAAPSPATRDLATKITQEYYIPTEAELGALPPEDSLKLARLMERVAQDMLRTAAQYKARLGTHPPQKPSPPNNESEE